MHDDDIRGGEVGVESQVNDESGRLKHLLNSPRVKVPVRFETVKASTKDGSGQLLCKLASSLVGHASSSVLMRIL
jgi:hypothetical protein